jgi:hypothetical protein
VEAIVMKRITVLASVILWASLGAPTPSPVPWGAVAWAQSSDGDSDAESSEESAESDSASEGSRDDSESEETSTEEASESEETSTEEASSTEDAANEDLDEAGPEAPAGSSGRGVPNAPAAAGPTLAPAVDVDEEMAAPEEEGEAPTEGEEESKAGSVAALGAGSAMVSDQEGVKPWTLSVNLGLGVGTGAFVTTVSDFDTAGFRSNTTAPGGPGPGTEGRGADALVSYNFSTVGLYKLTKLWMGRLDGYARVGFNGIATETFTTSALGQTETTRPVFFEDIRLGVLGRSLFKEKNTGIIFGSNLIFRLPTGDQSQAVDRVLRTDLSVNATKVFSGVGPGNMILGFSQGFRYDIGPANPTVNLNEYPSLVQICDEPGNSADECASSINSVDWGLSTSLSLRYLMNIGLNFGVTVAGLYLRSHDLRDSPINGVEGSVGGTPNDVGTSPFDSGDVGASALLFTSVSIGYAITDHIAVSGGLSTFQSAIIQSGNNPRSLVNPFYAADPELNLSSLFVNATFNY